MIYKDKLQTVEKPLLLSNNWVEGRSPQQGLGAVAPHSAPARMPGVYAKRLCTMQSQQSIHSPSHGEGVWGFGKDAEIERPKVLQDAKPTKRSYRDREFALFFIKADFFSKM